MPSFLTWTVSPSIHSPCPHPADVGRGAVRHLGRVERHAGHRAELLDRVTVHHGGRGVRLDDRPGAVAVRLEDEDRLARLLEERTVARLARAQRRLHLHALGDVAHEGEGDRLAAELHDPRPELDGEGRPVLRHERALPLEIPRGDEVREPRRELRADLRTLEVGILMQRSSSTVRPTRAAMAGFASRIAPARSPPAQ